MATDARIPVNRLPVPSGGVRGAVDRVLASGWYILGPELAAFEREFAAFCGASDCVGVASGTDALELAMRALGVRPGDDVVVAPNAGGYSSTAAWAIGASPRYADVDPDSHCVTGEAVERAVTPRTAAIVVTHLYGQIAPDIERIVRWASYRSIPVIEDCAQAAGATLGGRSAGSFADAGAYSFYPTKNLGALGDAGAVVTSRADVAAGVRARRQYGWSTRYRMETPGGRNSRMDEIQAAVLRAQLPDLRTRNERRRAILRRLAASMPPSLGRFSRRLDQAHVAHLAVAVLAVDRDRFRSFMEGRGIATDVHYPLLDFDQPVAATHGVADVDLQDCSVARDLSHRCVTLPCFPDMTDDEVDRICRALSAAEGELM